MNDVTLRAWSEDEFAAARGSWTELLSRSDADPLFMSWDWQWRWWHHHRDSLGAGLQLLAIRTNDGRLIGLAPFHERRVRVRGALPITRLELIGSAWRCESIAFSEYLDVIADRTTIPVVTETIAEWLRTADRWQDAVFAAVRGSSVAAQLVSRHLSAIAHVREVDGFEAHCIALPASGEIYARSLAPEVRRRTYGQRDRIEPAAIAEATAATLDAAFQRLDDFTERRWQRQVLGAESRRFRSDFARAMAVQGALQMTELTSAGEVISVLYDVRRGDTEYYLQSGFDAGRSSGVSLGYLHFGYAIERACEAGITQFDLLGGAGRHRDYKGDFRTERQRLTSLHLVRAPWLRALHALRRTVGAH